MREAQIKMFAPPYELLGGGGGLNRRFKTFGFLYTLKVHTHFTIQLPYKDFFLTIFTLKFQILKVWLALSSRSRLILIIQNILFIHVFFVSLCFSLYFCTKQVYFCFISLKMITKSDSTKELRFMVF